MALNASDKITIARTEWLIPVSVYPVPIPRAQMNNVRSAIDCNINAFRLADA